MSLSPTGDSPPSDNAEYFRNWDVLGLLSKRGSSFSGRERNCVFLNTGDRRFADVSAVTQLDFPDDGRAVGLTDWDHDGDVDMWLANRTAPRLRLIRNDLPNANQCLALKLVGRTCNRDAIGARVEVYLDGPESRRLIDTLRAGDGYLTQSTKWLHFGVGQAERIKQLRVRWPGEASWEEFGELKANARYRIIQGTGTAERLDEPRARTPLAACEPRLPPTTDEARVVLTARIPLQLTDYLGFDGQKKTLREGTPGPVLLNFWASWCEPCLRELRDFADHRQALEKAGVIVVPLCTDQLGKGSDPFFQQLPEGDAKAAEQLLRKLGLPSVGGFASADAVAQLTHLQSWIFYKLRPLPLPSSFLLDAEGRLAVIYRGATSADQVLRDVSLLDAAPETVFGQALPSTGHFLFPKSQINPLLLVRAHREGGYLADAKKELEDTLARAQKAASRAGTLSDAERRFLAEVYRELAAVEAGMGQTDEAVAALQEAVRLDPENMSLVVALALAWGNQGDVAKSQEQLDRIADKAPADPSTWRILGQAWLQLRDTSRAISHFSRALELAPDDLKLRSDLAAAYQLQGDGKSAAEQCEQILASDPSSADAANNLAWIYATDADSHLRNGARAMELAQQACRLTQNQRPVFLGTLSAAYAETGQFDEAVKTIQQAIRLAQGIGQDQLVADLQRRLQLHQQGLPYHQPGRDP